MNENELRQLRVILHALAMQNNLLQWVNQWAYGRNEGGGYVSLFSDRLQYRVCAVYEERFRELPPFIRDNLPADGDGVEISTDRTVLERKGQLRTCTPFQIARYSVGDGDKAAWRFSGVVTVAQQKPEEPPAPASQPPEQKPQPAPVISFETMADAIHYGTQRGVYPDYDTARAAYYALRTALQPKTPQEMFTAWVNQVEGIKATAGKFDAPTPEARGATPANGKASASQKMAARVQAA